MEPQQASDARFAWSAQEHEHVERTPDWYWALGITAVCIALTAALFHNVLFGILILLAAATLALLSRTEPPITRFEVSDRGIRVGNELHRYNEILGFWIEDQATPAHLLVDTTKPFAPNLIVPLHDIDHEALRTLLLKHAKETPMKVPLSHKIFEALGF